MNKDSSIRGQGLGVKKETFQARKICARAWDEAKGVCRGRWQDVS